MDKWKYYKEHNINKKNDLYETIYEEIYSLCGYLFEITDVLLKISKKIDTIIKQKVNNDSFYVKIIHPDTNESVYIFINVFTNIKRHILCCIKSISTLDITCIICKPENEHSFNTLQKYISNSAKI